MEALPGARPGPPGRIGLALRVAWAGLERVHLRRSLSRTALAFPPGLLLAVVLLGRGLPLGALTDPVAVLVDVDRVLVVPLDLRVGAGTAP